MVERSMATIKDVAELARVSTATVSHVLNGSREVQQVTRQRVLAAVSKLGYSRNMLARNLVTGKSHILGMLVTDLGNPFYPDLIRAFQDQAGLYNMETLVLNTNYDSER